MLKDEKWLKAVTLGTPTPNKEINNIGRIEEGQYEGEEGVCENKINDQQTIIEK